MKRRMTIGLLSAKLLMNPVVAHCESPSQAQKLTVGKQFRPVGRQVKVGAWCIGDIIAGLGNAKCNKANTLFFSNG